MPSRKTTKKKKQTEGPSQQRSKDETGGGEGTPPDPPPPPPAALVKLLQKNKSVLKYFQALQENLDYDVKKWKLRARRYQADSLEWKAKAEAMMSAERGSVSASNKKRPAHPISQEEVEEEELTLEHQPQRQRLRTEKKTSSKVVVETTTASQSSTSGRKSKAASMTCTAESAVTTIKNNNKSKAAGKRPADEMTTTTTTKNPSSLKQATAEDEEDWLDLDSMSSDDDEEEEEAEETTPDENQKKAEPSQRQSTIPPLSILAMSSEDSEEDEEEDDDDGKEKVDEPSSRLTGTLKRAPLNILALSSDDDDDDDDEYSTGWLESQFTENQPQESPPAKEKNSQVLESLKKANDLLLQLGIALTEETPIPQEDQKGEGDEENVNSDAEAAQPKVIFRRRTDSCVLADLLQSIKALVRIHVDQKKEEEVLESYYPFMTKGLIPCFTPHHESNTLESSSPPPHPAVEGMKSLSDAFHLIETFCSSLDEIDEEELDDHDHDQRLFLGMKDRHTMVSKFLQSLEGEICQLWPVQDRATRLLTTSIHFEPTDDDEDIRQSSSNNKNIHAKMTIAAPTKNFPRLAALVERCFLAQLVSRMHLARQDPRARFQFFWRYLMATTPAIGIDSSATPFKLPPVQSICVLESILLCSGSVKDDILDSSHWPGHKADWKWISRAVCWLVQVTGTIQLARRNSEDDRIADTARVELAAKARLEAKHPFWKEYSPLDEIDGGEIQRITEELQTMVKDVMRAGENGDVSPMVQPLLLPALLVTLGSARSVDNLFTSTAETIDTGTITRVWACVKAKKCLEIRMIEKHRKVAVLSPSTLVEGGMRLWDYSKKIILKAFNHQHNKGEHQIEFHEFTKLALATCLELADGESAVTVLKACLTGLGDDSSHIMREQQPNTPFLSSLKSTLNLMETVGEAIVVRVINLERRPDRLASFLAQAAHCNLLVMRGVMDMGKDESSSSTMQHHNPSLYYCYAFDGGNGRPAEIETRLAERLGCTREEMSSQFVQTRWRPNDLQVFDSEAPDSLEETRISPSEKACALSHIASWKGVLHSLEMMEQTNHETEQKDFGNIFRHPSHWRQKFQISGNARGPPLFPENEGMSPAPVCIILEDDAVLVDRFTDRLQAVLEELPRDFYFCSIGYSRPKTAPLIPFSSEISIPSCIWYLTGYILSLQGCRYLLSQLPVRGPVDSWIGLKMFGNWDNLYGHAMGVGMSGNHKSSNNAAEQSKTISKKDLRKLFKFRAFCATVPLCSQKVGTGLGGGDRNWRHRDTDIVYSGNSI